MNLTVHPLLQDLVFSLRSLRRTPGFTVIALLTLVLGIAGSNIIFSLINTTLLRKLPYPDSSRLVILHWHTQGDISALAFFMVKSRARSFSSVAALYPVEAGVNLSGVGAPQYIQALSVSKDFFPTLGVPPQIGNTFSPEQDQPNAPPTAVLSYGLWTRSFNREPQALGRDLRLNGQTYKIIGVMPMRFHSYPEADIWLPLQLNAGSADPGSNYRVIARLASGASRQQAQYELEAIARDYQLSYLPSAPKAFLVASDLQDFLLTRERQGLAILFVAVVLMFLIACTNVAVLMLVRGTASAQTTAVRVALGPPKGRLLFSLMTESLLLSGAAGLLGLILTKESFPLLLWLWPPDLPIISSLKIDWHVALFTFAISILSLLLFGLAPALTLSRVNIARTLAYASPTSSAAVEQLRTVRMWVLAQMVLTIVLLSGTLLLVKSLLNLYSVPLGFDPENLIVAQVSLSGERYRATSSTCRLLDEVIKQLEAVPGVDSVSGVDGLPLQNGLNIPLHPVEMPQAVVHAVEYRPVTARYFRTLQISLRSGRFFVSEDTAGSMPVAMVNESLARLWWPDTSAVGHLIQVDQELGPQVADRPRKIVGIVSDIREKGSGVPPAPTIFIPLNQTPDKINGFFNKVFLTSLVMRASPHMDLSGQVRNAIQTVDPNLPLASFLRFNQVIDRSLSNQRFLALVIVAFGAFALLLSLVGIQGLMTLQARLREKEIAIRMAVGASRVHVVSMIVQEAGKLIGLALLMGLAGSLVIPKLLGSMLYNIGATSPIWILSAGVVLGSSAVLISLLTAVRAASIEPMAVLRNE
ncbi:MAG TPA: ABC transporter permease [Candidatus Angelobacter sp.]